MSDLIEREAAVRAIRHVLEMMFRSDWDCSTPELMSWRDKKLVPSLFDAIRALPAATDERRCETCGRWDRNAPARTSGNRRCGWVYDFALLTPPDHYCAAWQAKEAGA